MNRVHTSILSRKIFYQKIMKSVTLILFSFQLLEYVWLDRYNIFSYKFSAEISSYKL